MSEDMPGESRIGGKTQEARFGELTEDAKRIGCLETLKKHGHDIAYLTDERRSAYLELLGIGREDDVLEIGSSMGQHTRRIAKLCRSVRGVEADPMQTDFSRLWCKEDGLDNVKITAGGADGTLPCDDASFDLVICNYVLEWSAGNRSDNDRDPGAFHRRFLRDIFRVLRPGGRLFLSTKNRFAIRYLLGSEDEHLQARFGSALPRTIQRLLRARIPPDRPAGYLHSWRGLEREMTAAGFCALERILAFPDARYPDYIGPFEGFTPPKPRPGIHKWSRFWLGESITRASLLLPPRLFRATTNSIVLSARKQARK